MILQQHYLACLAHASYLVVDERTRVAVVVDPQRDVEVYLEAAERAGARIEHVILTHFHADFLAGHLELRERVGATIHLGARAQAEYPFHALHDGDTLELGDVRLEVLETPGHTPEGISILVYDRTVSDSVPHAVFTGDTLFVGDVGRPDLLASIGVSAEQLADWLYDSLHGKLLALPDSTLVYPAHGAGSMCGKNLGSETFTTIGEQRRSNYALQPMTREAFRSVVTADQPQAPAYFVHDAILNRKERPTLEASLSELRPLGLQQVLDLQAAGAQVLDVRDSEAFAAGHLAGSTNVGLSGKYATWAGTLLSVDRPIVIVAAPGDEQEAALRLGRIGLDDVAGYLEGGAAALEQHPEHRATLRRLDVSELAARLQAADGTLVLDVRGPGEFEDGHVIGATNLPLPQLRERLAEVPRDRPVAVVCRSGYRSSAAVSLLAAAGLHDTLDVVGGMLAWAAAELPTTAPVKACQG